MILTLFKRKSFGQLIILPIIALALWFVDMQNPVIEDFEYSSLFFKWFFELISAFPYGVVVIGFVLVIFQAIYLNYVLVKYELMPRGTYYAALIFLVFCLYHPRLAMLSPQMVAVTFLIFSLDRQLSLYEKDEPFRILFGAGFSIAIASLFYFPSAIFLLGLIISVISFGTVSWRGWIVSITGFLIPFLYLWFYYFWTDQIQDAVSSYTVLVQDLALPGWMINEPFHVLVYVIWALLSLCAVFSFQFLLMSQSEWNIRTRRSVSLAVWTLLAGLLSLFIANHSLLSQASLLLYPLAVFVSLTSIRIKKTQLLDIVFLTLFILTFVIRFI